MMYKIIQQTSAIVVTSVTYFLALSRRPTSKHLVVLEQELLGHVPGPFLCSGRGWLRETIIPPLMVKEPPLNKGHNENSHFVGRLSCPQRLEKQNLRPLL